MTLQLRNGVAENAVAQLTAACAALSSSSNSSGDFRFYKHGETRRSATDQGAKETVSIRKDYSHFPGS